MEKGGGAHSCCNSDTKWCHPCRLMAELLLVNCAKIKVKRQKAIGGSGGKVRILLGSPEFVVFHV